MRWDINTYLHGAECSAYYQSLVSCSCNARYWRSYLRQSYRPLHGIRHRKIQSSQCACRGQKVHSISFNCVLTREFLVKTKQCLLVASWTVKIAPVLESSFSGFLQDLIRLKKIDDICDCKLLNRQTGTILRSKRLMLVAFTSYQETLKSSFIIPFCLLKLESLDCMNSFLYVKLCKLIVL